MTLVSLLIKGHNCIKVWSSNPWLLMSKVETCYLWHFLIRLSILIKVLVMFYSTTFGLIFSFRFPSSYLFILTNELLEDLFETKELFWEFEEINELLIDTNWKELLDKSLTLFWLLLLRVTLLTLLLFFIIWLSETS